MMSIFRFKKFNVINEQSAMKVNTDGVLLGALVSVKQHRRILDVGTGTGTIALMAAQRLAQAGVFDMQIDAIDIDEPSAAEAAENFRNSPWASSLQAHHTSLTRFSEESREEYDLILSNPPYFEDSLTAPDERKSIARHTSEGLSYRDIFEFSAQRLSSEGSVALVLPSEQESDVCRYARMCGLYVFRIVRVRTVPRKAPSRIVVEFSRTRVEDVQDEMLTIQDEGKYTQEYLSLTHDFYLFA